MNILNFVDYVTAAKGDLEVIKAALNLIPKDVKTDKTREQIERAEQALKASEAAAAKAFGYALCKCTFPPQIMLWIEADKAHLCPNSSCGRKIAERGSAPDDDCEYIRCRL
jgi:hypothetical protein